ncbi:MAG: PHP domain-containing protein [Chloroflexi bacterium]|nr:PHP domain-containing protein [Chloroflexota bacterium]
MPAPCTFELHAHSCFSLLDRASFPEDLVARAAALGMPALALTDYDAICGVVRFVQAAKAQGLPHKGNGERGGGAVCDLTGYL